jgi:4-hydroxy-tetrahydrodipicolinate synthase
VGYGIPAIDMAEIARTPGVVGVKEASPDIAQLVDLVATLDGTDCLVLGGAENTIWPALAVGASGNTATAASVIPAVFAKLWELAQEGRSREGADLYRVLHPLRQAYGMAGGQAAVVKHLLDRAGLAGGPVRPPARQYTNEADSFLDRLVASVTTSGLWTA